jgi:glutamate-1-semialdehyde 2,1-aminomutase
MDFEKSGLLQKKSHLVIPGGCHTYAKGDDQYPLRAPGFIARGAGCHVWDVDGNEFIEFGMGLRAVTLGHAYKPVVEAVSKQLNLGSNFVRPAPIEIACAEELLSLIEGGQMVKFAKNGSDVTSAAVRLGRAYTGKDMVAICADDPFYSIDDWFIGTTPVSAGVPKAISSLTLKFHYNDIESAKSLFDRYPDKIACVILEPEKYNPPQNDFLLELKRLCQRNGAVFILDEIITGFRWHNGGAQKYYGVVPDLSTFGKGLGNGLSVSALVGKKELMELGGIQHKKERVFLLSLTHGAETHNLAGALEVMRIYKAEPVVEALWRQGQRLKDGVNQSIQRHGLEGFFEVLGKPCCLVYATRDSSKQPSQPFRTLFLQEIIKRGILAPSFVVSYSHSDTDIDRTIKAVDEALSVYRKALEDGVDKYLIGRPVKPVYRKFN